METAGAAAVEYRNGLDGLGKSPARPTIGLDEAVARFRTALPDEGMSETAVIDHILRDATGALHAISTPTFFGYVLGSSHPVGVAADFLVSAWGQNSGMAFETPAITGMERAVCDWVIDLLSLPPESGAGLVTGGTVANMVGVMAARNALLAAQGWDVERAVRSAGDPGAGRCRRALFRALRRPAACRPRSASRVGDDCGCRRPDRCGRFPDGEVMVTLHCRLARRLAEVVAAEAGLHVLNEIHGDQVAVACGERSAGDAQTMALLRRIQERGRVHPTHGDWSGRKIIRCSVIGYAMRDAHADLLSSEIIDAWGRVRSRPERNRECAGPAIGSDAITE